MMEDLSHDLVVPASRHDVVSARTVIFDSSEIDPDGLFTHRHVHVGSTSQVQT